MMVFFQKYRAPCTTDVVSDRWRLLTTIDTSIDSASGPAASAGDELKISKNKEWARRTRR
jgi:hypothetical protein